jgi:hypothetical protein
MSNEWTYKLTKHNGDKRFYILFSYKDGVVQETRLVSKMFGNDQKLVDYYVNELGVGDKFEDLRFEVK